jgi:two-component system response regulator AtoC
MLIATVNRPDSGLAASAPLTDSEPIDLLIADDELVIRRMLELALKSSGLRIRTVTNGAEALRLYRKLDGNVGLVLLDVQMPELDGPQAFREMQQIAPDVRVLFMSGGSGKYSADDLLEMGALGLLAKPFENLADVAAKLRRLATARVEQLR